MQNPILSWLIISDWVQLWHADRLRTALSRVNQDCEEWIKSQSSSPTSLSSPFVHAELTPTHPPNTNYGHSSGTSLGLKVFVWSSFWEKTVLTCFVIFFFQMTRIMMPYAIIFFHCLSAAWHCWLFFRKFLKDMKWELLFSVIWPRNNTILWLSRYLDLASLNWGKTWKIIIWILL